MSFIFFVKKQTISYALTRSHTDVDEGVQFTITLITAGVAPGTLIPYTITGASSADLNGASLTGNFTVSGTSESGTSTIQFTTTADFLAEGPETVVISLDNGLASAQVLINDTSASSPTTRVLANFDNSLSDASQYAYPAATVGTYTYSDGKFGYTGDKAYVTPSSGLAYTGFEMGTDLVAFLNQSEWTIEFFMKRPNEGLQGVLTVGMHNSVGYGPISVMLSGSELVAYFSLQGNTWNTSITTSGNSVPVNEWKHIVLCKGHAVQPTGVSMFVNGALKGSAALAGSFSAPSYSSEVLLATYAKLGGYNGTGMHFDGLRLSDSIVYPTDSFTVPTTPYIN